MISKIANDSRRMEQNEPNRKKHAFKRDSGGGTMDDPNVKVKAEKFSQRFRAGQVRTLPHSRIPQSDAGLRTCRWSSRPRLVADT